MIKAIIFDFDGVILESACIKTDAFAEVVKDYPKDMAEAFVNYHMAHMGISRHVKFKYFITDILGETYSEEKEQELADSFSSIVFDKVMTCDFVPGAKEFLDNNYKKYDLYIATGTPTDEIKQITHGRDLSKYFKAIYGTPSSKSELTEKIIKDNGYTKEEVIFVGDAGTDLEAAKKNDIIFVGRRTSENTNVFKDIQYKIDNLLELEEICNFTESK